MGNDASNPKANVNGDNDLTFVLIFNKMFTQNNMKPTSWN